MAATSVSRVNVLLFLKERSYRNDESKSAVAGEESVFKIFSIFYIILNAPNYNASPFRDKIGYI